MSGLPPYRFPAAQPSPFQQTGLDVFGPFASKTPSQTYDKHYGLILTCLSTRAVHIEMCHNLSLDATMTALCHFLHAVVNHTRYEFYCSRKRIAQTFPSTISARFLRSTRNSMDLQPTESASFRGRLGTTHTFLQRHVLRHFGQLGANR